MAARSSSDFRLLAAGDVQGAPQPGFRLRLRRPRLSQEQDASEATDFRFPPAFLMLLHQGVGLGQRLEAVFRVAQVVSDLRQHGAKVGTSSAVPVARKAAIPWRTCGHPLLALALHGQRPPTQDRCPGRPLWKALLGRERDSGLCLLVHGRHVAAKLRDEGRHNTAQTPD